MSDDLSAFFAKKKAKGTKKKAIRLDDVGQQLELNLRFEKEQNEEDGLHQEKQFVAFTEEDPEWIDYGAKPLTGETVGTFNFNEQAEEELSQDRTSGEQPVVEKEDTPKETVIPAVTTTQSKFETYRPPTQRQSNQHGLTKRTKVDLKSEEMFPSLGDAEKIEKQQTEDQRKQRVEEVKPATPVSQDIRAEQPEKVKFTPPPTPPAPVPASAPIRRPTPPPPNSTGMKNAKGEWIILEDKAFTPEERTTQREPTTWRKVEESEAAVEASVRSAVPKSNPFGAAKPVSQRLPASFQNEPDDGNSWRRKEEAPTSHPGPPSSTPGAYQAPTRGYDREGREPTHQNPEQRSWRNDRLPLQRDVLPQRQQPAEEGNWRRQMNTSQPQRTVVDHHDRQSQRGGDFHDRQAPRGGDRHDRQGQRTGNERQGHRGGDHAPSEGAWRSGRKEVGREGPPQEEIKSADGSEIEDGWSTATRKGNKTR